MNPSATHSIELKSTIYPLAPTTASSSTSELIPTGQQRLPSYSSSSGGARFHDTTSFTPLVTVDTTESANFPNYFSPTASAATSSFHTPSTFNSHHPMQSSYASLISETDVYCGRQVKHPYLSYANSANTVPSLQHFIGGLTSKLPDLQCSTGGNMNVAYSAPHMVGVASPHASHISQGYSPSSVTTQGIGGGGNYRRIVLDVDGKPGAFKSRSKKESHNRIERRRRDYINSQIIRLSGLLPADMYRDADGRRNKGTVLRLSVNYILELRQTVAHLAILRQETVIARQLIPFLLNQIQSLESVVKEVEMSTGKLVVRNDQGTSSLLEENSRAYEAILEAWRMTMTTNLTRVPLGNNSEETPQEGEQESMEMPLMENTQVTFAGRPPNIAASPYLPNANFMGESVCKLEKEDGGISYGGGNSSSHIVVGNMAHTSEDTTDGYFDSTNSNNSHISVSASKFHLSMMQQAPASAECGDRMQVQCQDH